MWSSLILLYLFLGRENKIYRLEFSVQIVYNPTFCFYFKMFKMFMKWCFSVKADKCKIDIHYYYSFILRINQAKNNRR